LGKVPVLETDEGSVFEPNAAARYVARLSKNHLYGSSTFEAGQVDQWVDFAANEIEIPANVWIFPILGFIENNAVATQKAKGDIRQVLDVLNKHLQTRTYLVGHRITLADIVVSMALYRLYVRVLDPGFRKLFINTNRWFLTCINQPEFRAIVGETKLCEKMEVVKEGEQKKEKPKKEAAKEKQEPKKEKQEPKKEKQEPKKESAEEEPSEDPDEGPKEPKQKNPLDALPPSKFNLDEWKRTYSNNDTTTVANPWFWVNYDPEGFSIWFGDYKYNDELEKLFMTCNLVAGFFQRVEKLRKYGFGSVIIFGEEPKLEISCCWLFRGQDMPAEMKECDDAEHYTWRKADIKDEATRKLVSSFWSWEGDFGGRKMNQGKIFK